VHKVRQQTDAVYPPSPEARRPGPFPVVAEEPDLPVRAGELEIRAMQTADVRRTVEVHLSAFPDFFLSFLGPRFLRLFYSEVVALGEIGLVASIDRTIIGFVMGSVRPSGFFWALIRRRGLAFALAAVVPALRRPAAALRILRALRKPRDAAKPEGTATLMSLGVSSEAQGLGVGKELVRRFQRVAASRGARTVDLTTDKLGNERTNAFYRSLGFRVVREIITPERRVLNEYEIDVRNS
jgi:ribosomal protein S18 acetylase RimI-like enzyme